MYAVITSPKCWKDIEQAINTKEEEILYKKIDSDIDIVSELEICSRLSVAHLIIDITALNDLNNLPNAIRNYRILRENTQIIVIAPNCLPGNKILSLLVTMGVYDIINPKMSETESLEILPSLLSVLEKPASYARAVKWDIGVQSINNLNNTTDDNTRNKDKERTVTVIKDKIVGTVVIVVAGTMNRIGTTHTAISIAKFLQNQNFKVGLLELHNSNGFNAIKNSYVDIEDKGNMFELDNMHFYPYSKELKVLDILQEDYNYIVIDMGIYNECNMEEFKRANSRIIVSGVKDWELSNLELILKNGDTIYKNNYYFTFSDKDSFIEVKNNMDQLNCYLAPYNPNPFINNKECVETFKNLLKNVLPEIKKTNNNKNIFKSIFRNKKGKVDVIET